MFREGDLLEVLSRLNKMDAGSKKIDAEIYEMLGHPESKKSCPIYQSISTDLGSLIKFMDWVLPGVDWVIGSAGPHMPGFSASVYDEVPVEGEKWQIRVECSPTPELALCIAMIGGIRLQLRAQPKTLN